MSRAVRAWVRTCAVCQSRKSPPQKPPGHLIPKDIPAPNHTIRIDLLGPFRCSRSGKRWIVVCTDDGDKWAWTGALPNSKASTIARWLLDHVIFQAGPPHRLLSDQGANLLHQLIQLICEAFNTVCICTTAYHPQTNALTERLNATLANLIASYVDEDQRDWDLHLPALTFAYNTSFHPTTLETPFFLRYGRDPTLPIDISLQPPPEQYQPLAPLPAFAAVNNL